MLSFQRFPPKGQVLLGTTTKGEGKKIHLRYRGKGGNRTCGLFRLREMTDEENGINEFCSSGGNNSEKDNRLKYVQSGFYATKGEVRMGVRTGNNIKIARGRLPSPSSTMERPRKRSRGHTEGGGASNTRVKLL